MGTTQYESLDLRIKGDFVAMSRRASATFFSALAMDLDEVRYLWGSMAVEHLRQTSTLRPISGAGTPKYVQAPLKYAQRVLEISSRSRCALGSGEILFPHMHTRSAVGEACMASLRPLPRIHLWSHLLET